MTREQLSAPMDLAVSIIAIAVYFLVFALAVEAIKWVFSHAGR